jgi:hypothetical protein
MFTEPYPSNDRRAFKYYSRSVARIRLSKYLPKETNTHATVVEFLNRPLLCGPCHIKGKYAISSSEYRVLLFLI